MSDMLQRARDFTQVDEFFKWFSYNYMAIFPSIVSPLIHGTPCMFEWFSCPQENSDSGGLWLLNLEFGHSDWCPMDLYHCRTAARVFSSCLVYRALGGPGPWDPGISADIQLSRFLESNASMILHTFLERHVPVSHVFFSCFPICTLPVYSRMTVLLKSQNLKPCETPF